MPILNVTLLFYRKFMQNKKKTPGDILLVFSRVGLFIKIVNSLYGNRTRVSAVRGRRLDLLTNGPSPSHYRPKQMFFQAKLVHFYIFLINPAHLCLNTLQCIIYGFIRLFHNPGNFNIVLAFQIKFQNLFLHTT